MQTQAVQHFPGTLVYVVGASGAGKDSLIRHAQTFFVSEKCPHASPRLRFVRRFITRPAQAGGEQHTALSPQEFAVLKQQGRFLFDWESHGLCYGIGAEIVDWLKNGDTVVMNGSRSYAQQAFARIAPIICIEVVVQPAVLRERLHMRGRETPEQIEGRLLQASVCFPQFSQHVRIDNSGNITRAQEAFISTLSSINHYTTIRSMS